MLFGNNISPSQQPFGIQFQNLNPMQKTQYVVQALSNPVAFVQQMMPNLPPAISNDPNRILQYMQQSGMVTPQQVQEAASVNPATILQQMMGR